MTRHLQSADFRARLAADGSEPVANSPSEFAAVIQADVQRWSKLIRSTGIKLQRRVRPIECVFLPAASLRFLASLVW
ncbi:MAG: hypothetical protein A3G24_15355 [Betaproteobacteria bacterium RIFCSPLOWO2_12_FULL_62_13]|nr:MAG: hypothetical protein A3G24_15355 [Betaproteobacteria bacterium RIFCSPLOWO2_12_FULL_62_13]